MNIIEISLEDIKQSIYLELLKECEIASEDEITRFLDKIEKTE